MGKDIMKILWCGNGSIVELSSDVEIMVKDVEIVEWITDIIPDIDTGWIPIVEVNSES